VDQEHILENKNSLEKSLEKKIIAQQHVSLFIAQGHPIGDMKKF